MGIFGKKIEKKYGEEVANAAEVKEAKKERNTSRRGLIDERRSVFKDIIDELKSDITEFALEGGMDEDIARVYLILKKYEKPVMKLVDSYYEDKYLEINKTEILEDAVRTLASQAATQNELIEKQNKILESIAKALEKKDK